MATPYEIWQWRQTLRQQNRYGTPYARNQPKPASQNWWQRLTPWKEEEGETFGQVWDKPLKTFGAVVTSPFTPSTPGTEGLSWLQREQKEYEKWEEPTWTMPWGAEFRPTKGIVETLPFFAGGAAIGAAGRLGALAARGGALGKAAGLGQKALKPAVAFGKAEQAVTGAALKGVGAVVKPLVTPVQKVVMKVVFVFCGKPI